MTKRLQATAYFRRLPTSPVATALTLSVVVGTVTGCITPDYTAFPDHGTPVSVPLPPEPVSDRVLATAAQDLGLPQSELSILRVNEETWTDGCLGIGLPDEGCLQTLIEGWQLEVFHDSQSWFYRTDATGESVRQSYLDNNLPPSLSEIVLSKAAMDNDTARESLEVFKAEPRTWDGCLGIEEHNQVCPQAVYFGWRVTVVGENQLLVYHTDMLGYQVRLNLQESAIRTSLIDNSLPLQGHIMPRPYGVLF
ncbi:MAG: hypothetical protein AAF716_22395 [Cyanobacteria bacterium P01_D01_bin.1]